MKSVSFPASLNLLALVLLAGGCASAAHDQKAAAKPAPAAEKAPVASAKPASGQPSVRAGTPATAAPAASGGTMGSAIAAATGKYTAIIDGKEVPCPDIPMGDDATIRRILEEGKNHNQVMEHLKYLTSQIGPRLTGSSNAFAANQWCMAQYKKWGLSNAHLEQWGTIGTGFDRGESTGKLFLRRDAGGG